MNREVAISESKAVAVATRDDILVPRVIAAAGDQAARRFLEFFAATIRNRWLRVSGTTEMPQIDQCVGHQFHTVVSLLFELEAQLQPLEFIFPREGPLHA